MRRVDEAIEPLAPGQPPRAFRWRGRRYVVPAELTHWVETGAWWGSGSAGGTTVPVADHGVPDHGVPDHERGLWRVEAGSRNRPGSGVLDLCLDPHPSADPAGGGWSVRHVYD